MSQAVHRSVTRTVPCQSHVPQSASATIVHVRLADCSHATNHSMRCPDMMVSLRRDTPIEFKPST